MWQRAGSQPNAARYPQAALDQRRIRAAGIEAVEGLVRHPDYVAIDERRALRRAVFRQQNCARKIAGPLIVAGIGKAPLNRYGNRHMRATVCKIAMQAASASNNSWQQKTHKIGHLRRRKFHTATCAKNRRQILPSP